MIRSLLLLGTGTAAGWLAHRAAESGRRVAEQEAGRRVRETLDPTRPVSYTHLRAHET